MSATRFGAFLFASQFQGMTEPEVLQAALRYATCAEQEGFADLWVNEHHSISYGINPSALGFAAFLLGRTTTMRVGTAVTLLPQHPPVFVAETASLLAHVSGGRLDLGIGRGGPVADLLVAGRSFDHWNSGFWDAVDVIDACWSGAARGQGPLYDFPEVVVKPRPPAGSPPPVFVASTSPTSLEQAARRGLPLLMFIQETDASRRANVERWAEVAEAHGHPAESPGHVASFVAHVMQPGDTEVELVDRLADFFVRSSAEYHVLPEAEAYASARHQEPDDLRALAAALLDTHPIGSVDQCVDRLVASLEGSSVERVMLMLEAVGDPDRVEANIRTVAREVIPAVHERLADAPRR